LRPEWAGVENLPTEGGFVLAPNHICNFDPVNMGYFMAAQGYETRFLAKESLFTAPVIGPIMKRWGMIPVLRGSSDATNALVNAEEAVLAGEAVGIYFEGTLTKDPSFWPMKGKTGTARLVLDTKVPLIPVVQWGPQTVLDRYSSALRLFRRTRIYVRALEPIDYSDLKDSDSSDREAVKELTRRLQDALEVGLGNLRGEVPPETVWDSKELGPETFALKNLVKWRRSLAKASKRNEILPAKPSLSRNSFK
jgi:1-acyl-sn-glycerol-3-phosphate acyltransferase